MSAKKFAKGSPSDGSALILTVVLTSLLAIVGVLFVMMARVNQIASSGLSESKELDSAIETVVAKISEELALDIPRKGPNGVERSEYYDYPDVNNAWLASLEPYKDGSDYKWRQISDATGYLEDKSFSTQNVDVKPVGLSTTVYVREYPVIKVDSDGEFLDEDGNPATEGVSADADGDGIADSKWIELADVTSSKGRPIYAAIRIIDNGGMLNVNTAYKFDPNETNKNLIDGSSQMQINLMGLSERDQTHTSQQKIDRLWSFRAGLAPNDVSSYEQNVVWQYGNPTSGYIPFDISDEMKLRNRYLLNYNKITTRIEKLWTNAYDGGPEMPLPTDDYKLNRWLDCTTFDLAAPNDYDYRHISTTHNMDRIIDANGEKMVNINRADANSIYRAIKSALDPNFADVNDVAAQIAVNLIDFRDNDSNATTFLGDTTYYGFERPCVYISELAHNFKKVPVPGGVGPVPGIQYITYRSYGIELHKPYLEDDYPDPNQWQLSIEGYGTVPVDWSGTKRFHVIYFEDLNAPLNVIFESGYDDPNLPKYERKPPFARYSEVFEGGDLIELQRRVGDVNGVWITVDSKYVPEANDANGWLAEDGIARSIQRDITLHKCIRRLWSSAGAPYSPTLGSREIGDYEKIDPFYIQAHPANTGFTNVGEIGMLFREDVYSRTWNSTDTEGEVRVDLAEPEFQQIFNYLTVFDPAVYPWNNPNEARIKGRVNINTAPWYVIAQLPWVSQREGSYNNTALAEAIVAYRDKTKAPGGDPNYSGRSGTAGFENIGQLCNVNLGSNSNFGIDYYSRDYEVDGTTPIDQGGFPDLTTPDGAANDFEERDLIFARISNLVTVRSDVFTAYILVRIGTDGPQKRVIAIFDRSDVYSPTNRVKIVAVHPVADPR